MAKWSARLTRNPAVSGSSPALWPLAGFVIGHWPELKSSATLVNTGQLVASCQLGFLILFVLLELFVFKYFSGVPAN